MKKKWIVLIVVIVLVVGGFFIKSLFKGKEQTAYQLDEIKRGNIENIVSCTGTLSAIETVSVGSQVSGILKELYVDYNSPVKKGQLLAVLDKTLLQAAVNNSAASVARTRSQFEQAEAEYKRNEPLFRKGHLSESEFLVFKTNMDTAHASMVSAEAVLKKDRVQLNYTEIRSPIDGTVIERTVDAGQTIQASFQAPELFTIAKDLTKMQIEAYVDESDIGQIKQGLSVRFTVQAYPDKTFVGNVRQIRLKPQVIQNVVNYTVVVDADNNENLLLPGMTATVDFLVEEVRDVLVVPNTALSFQPSQEMMMAMREQMKAERQGRKGAGGQREGGFPGFGQGGGFPGNHPGNGNDIGRVFYFDKNSQLRVVVFKKGATDGKMTEVKKTLRGSIEEGMRVVIGLAKVEPANETSTRQNNIFMPPRPGHRM